MKLYKTHERSLPPVEMKMNANQHEMNGIWKNKDSSKFKYWSLTQWEILTSPCGEAFTAKSQKWKSGKWRALFKMRGIIKQAKIANWIGVLSNLTVFLYIAIYGDRLLDIISPVIQKPSELRVYTYFQVWLIVLPTLR